MYRCQDGVPQSLRDITAGCQTEGWTRHPEGLTFLSFTTLSTSQRGISKKGLPGTDGN